MSLLPPTRFYQNRFGTVQQQIPAELECSFHTITEMVLFVLLIYNQQHKSPVPVSVSPQIVSDLINSVWADISSDTSKRTSRLDSTHWFYGNQQILLLCRI